MPAPDRWVSAPTKKQWSSAHRRWPGGNLHLHAAATSMPRSIPPRGCPPITRSELRPITDGPIAMSSRTRCVRTALKQVFSGNGAKLLTVRCDSPSNTVDLERIGDQLLCVHRHSATTAYGPGKREQVPRAYRMLGEPIVLPGSMGSSSYVALSMEGATELSLASASHGAGRRESRRLARKTFTADEARQRVEERGVMVRSPTPDLREEIPEAFRDVEKMLNVLERAGIVRRVARLGPRGVLKG